MRIGHRELFFISHHKYQKFFQHFAILLSKQIHFNLLHKFAIPHIHRIVLENLL